MLDRCNPDRLLDRPFERDPVELVATCTPLSVSLLSTDHQLGVAGLDVLRNDVVPDRVSPASWTASRTSTAEPSAN
jgi:hypothetical protein